MGIDPGTLAILSTVATGVGAVQGFIGQRNQGKAAANQAKYQSAVASNNAIIAQRNAQLAAQEGNAAVEAKQLETRAKIGAIKAAQGASGVDLNYGSAVDVRSSAAETGQLSALNIRSAAIRKAYGYQNEAKDYETQSDLYKTEAKNDILAGNTNATTSLLGDIGDATMNYSNYLSKRSTTGVLT